MNTYYGKFRAEEEDGFVYEGVIIVRASDLTSAYQAVTKRLRESLYGEESLVDFEELKDDVVLLHSDM